MIDPHFVLLGVLINFIGGISYLIDTVRGRTKPNRITWFLWSIAPLIAFFAELKQGVGLESLMTFIVGFNPLLIFIASFINRKSFWKISKLDIMCGILSVIGLICWGVTREGNVAIFFSILADALAALPTLIKSYKEPETETYLAFLTGGIAAFITLLTIKLWDFTHIGFPLYILTVNAIFVLLIKFELGKKISGTQFKRV